MAWWSVLALSLIAAAVLLGTVFVLAVWAGAEVWGWLKDKVKKLFPLIALLLLACQSPSQKQEAAQKKVETARTAIAATNLNVARVGAAYVKAADYALSLDPEPTRFTEAAKLSIGRATISLDSAGVIPDSADVLVLRRMVDGLLATNATLKAEATNILRKFDAALAVSESRETSLGAKLSALQSRLDAVNAENASLADTWTRLKSIFKWAVWALVAVFVLRVLGGVLPPPYNSPFHIVDAIAGGMGRVVMGVLPKAKEAAGVVARETHELTEDTLKRVVKSIEAFKERDPQGYETGLHPILARKMDPERNDAEIRRVKG